MASLDVVSLFASVPNIYVDDSFILFIVIIENKLPVLLKYLNQIHPSLKLTCEKEGEIERKNKISFLDILLEKTNGGNICLDLYKKKNYQDDTYIFYPHIP